MYQDSKSSTATQLLFMQVICQNSWSANRKTQLRIIRQMLWKTSVRDVVHPPVHGSINLVYVQFWQLKLMSCFFTEYNCKCMTGLQSDVCVRTPEYHANMKVYDIILPCVMCMIHLCTGEPNQQYVSVIVADHPPELILCSYSCARFGSSTCAQEYHANMEVYNIILPCLMCIIHLCTGVPNQQYVTVLVVDHPPGLLLCHTLVPDLDHPLAREYYGNMKVYDRN
jgi:hypothetical protein